MLSLASARAILSPKSVVFGVPRHVTGKHVVAFVERERFVVNHHQRQEHLCTDQLRHDSHSIHPESFGTFFLSPEIHADILRRTIRRVPHPLRGRVLSPHGACQGILPTGEFPFIEVDAKALNPLKTTSIHSAARMVESCATNPIRGGPARKPT
jgi:hypothetical protein